MPIILNPSIDTILTQVEREELSVTSLGPIVGSGEIVGLSADIMVEEELVESKVEPIMGIIGASVISEGELVGMVEGTMVYNDAQISDDDSSSNDISIPKGLSVGDCDGWYEAPEGVDVGCLISSSSPLNSQLVGVKIVGKGSEVGDIGLKVNAVIGTWVSGVSGMVGVAGLIEATVVGVGDTGGGNASRNPGPSVLEGVEASVVHGVGTCISSPMFSVDIVASPQKAKTKSRGLEQWKGKVRKDYSEMGGMGCKQGRGGERYGVIGCCLHFFLEQLTFRHDPNVCDAHRYNQ